MTEACPPCPECGEPLTSEPCWWCVECPERDAFKSARFRIALAERLRWLKAQIPTEEIERQRRELERVTAHCQWLDHAEPLVHVALDIQPQEVQMLIYLVERHIDEVSERHPRSVLLMWLGNTLKQLREAAFEPEPS